MSYITDYLVDAKAIIDTLDVFVIEKMVDEIAEIRANKGRLFSLA